MRAKTIKKYPKAKVYTDYREMLDKQKDIDGVVVATPDHTHAVISMAAMQAGKHVYCQKPLTHDVYEVANAGQGRQGVQGGHADGHPGAFHGRHPPDCEWVWAGADRRGPRGRRLVQPDLLSLGPRLLELPVVRPAQGDAARARRARLGPLDRPGADAALPSGLSPVDVALLVGLRLRHDGRPRGPHARPGRLGPEARRRRRASTPRAAATRPRSTRSRRS